MTKMATVLIYVKNLKIFFSTTTKLIAMKLGLNNILFIENTCM